MQLNKEAFEAGLLGRPVEKDVMEKAAWLSALARVAFPLIGSAGATVLKNPAVAFGLKHTAKYSGNTKGVGKAMHSFLTKANTPGSWQGSAVDVGLGTAGMIGTSAITEKLFPEQRPY